MAKIIGIDLGTTNSCVSVTSTFYQGSVKDIEYVVSDRDLNAFFTDPTPEKYILA